MEKQKLLIDEAEKAKKLISGEKEQITKTAQQGETSLHVAQVNVADKEDVIKQQLNSIKNFEQEIAAFRAEAEK